MKNILLYSKNSENAKKVKHKIQDFLSSKNINYFDLEKAPEKTYDMLVSIGGDGSFLKSVNLLNDKTLEEFPPILGINAGSLGFLTEIKIDESIGILEKSINEKFLTEERTLLSIDINGKKSYGLNDFVLNRKEVARAINLEIFYNDEFIFEIKGDGIIVSTPTGSTAYSLASGGPIIHPSIKSLLLTPVSPHTLTNRPVVLPDSGEIKIKTSDENVIATIDGQHSYPFKKSYVAKITKSDKKIKLVRPYGSRYFEILRDKLCFGKRG